MPLPALFRDAFVGQVIYLASGRRLLRRVEEQPDYVLQNATPSCSPITTIVLLHPMVRTSAIRQRSQHEKSRAPFRREDYATESVKRRRH